MSDTRPDQTEEILSYEISDEALESAANQTGGPLHSLLLHRLDLCPGP